MSGEEVEKMLKLLIFRWKMKRNIRFNEEISSKRIEWHRKAGFRY